MVKISVKRFFFDKRAVIDAIGKVEASNLSKAGAFIQRRAKSLLRRRKKSAEPGKPPSVHAPSGQFASLKTIFFAWDPSARTVVIGPVGLNSKPKGAQPDSTVPSLHEFGGRARVVQTKRRGPSVRKVVTYPPRPFMAPALDAERQAGTLIDVWRDSIKG